MHAPFLFVNFCSQGIGDKRAKDLVRQYGNIENMLASQAADKTLQYVVTGKDLCPGLDIPPLLICDFLLRNLRQTVKRR